MKADFQQDGLFSRLQIIVYSFAAIAITLMIHEQYQQGLYSLVLTNALAIPAFLFSAIFIFINRHLRRYLYVNYALIALILVLAFYQLPHYPQIMVHYIYALPMLLFFALPIRSATITGLSVGGLFAAILYWQQGWQAMIRMTTNYFLIFGAAWCFVYLTLVRNWALKRLALTDNYSGAYNYRHFTDAFKREISRSHSAGKEVSLLAFLIDDYAMLIDIYGQAMVNTLLPSLVDTIQQLVRTEDEVYRLAPDMFVLILPNCAEQHAQMLMERIKKGVSERSWHPINELTLTSVAMGAVVDEDAREAEKRLQAKLKKRRLTVLQMSAFGE